mmetsp:Transcript_1018/g.1346  ORF Transcript_1018/g.1346 Transcript_1018/m.1346 type:complete len:84 (-) Transcript_1018:138-389(-)
MGDHHLSGTQLCHSFNMSSQNSTTQKQRKLCKPSLVSLSHYGAAFPQLVREREKATALCYLCHFFRCQRLFPNCVYTAFEMCH